VKLSVCVITYNQRAFVPQAIASALAQRTSFEYEIVIGDDASTDGTRDALTDLQRQHPDRIRLLLRERNLGVNRNLVATLQACRGDYVALLEGDDFWTDDGKLQAQAECLDAEPRHAMCFHPVRVLYAADDRLAHTLPRVRPRRVSTIEDLIAVGNFIPTCSVVFRNHLIREFPDWFFTLRIGDFPLHVLNAQHGTIAYLPRTMGVYRVHATGSFSSQSNARNVQEIVRMYQHLNAHLGFRYDRTITAIQNYWQAVEHYRRGDVARARACAAKRATERPYNRQALMSWLMLCAPPVYRWLKRLPAPR
jgi:glycosyltransferase involved in cell wall biosynthesis